MQSATSTPAASSLELTTSATTSRTAQSASRTACSATRTPARSLGHQLERDRLEQRAARVRKVIVALRERAAAREVRGGAPRPLTAAIEDFGRELADLERRLRHAGR